MLTEGQIQILYTRGLINHATWTNAMRSFRGETTTHLGQHAIDTCKLMIDALVEEAVNAACKMIQDRLGVKTGDVAAAVLSDGAIERELVRYVHAELEMCAASPDTPEAA
jgi:hypothetical protein